MDQRSRFETHEIPNPPSELPAEIFDENYLQELKERFPESSEQFEDLDVTSKNERPRHVLKSEDYQSSDIEKLEVPNDIIPFVISQEPSLSETDEIRNPPSELPAEIFDENYLQELKEHFPESSEQFEGLDVTSENERPMHVLESEEYQSSVIQESEFANENYSQTAYEDNRKSNEESKGRVENSFRMSKNLIKPPCQELETKEFRQSAGHELEPEEIQNLETVKVTHAQISFESIRESSEETTGRNESVLDVSEKHVRSIAQIKTDTEYKSRILNGAVREKYICIVCGESCDSERDLRKHQRDELGEFPFICTFCGKAFDRESYLTVHIRTHTKEKPYACDKCGMSFSDRSAMNRHFLTHTEDKIFYCEKCGKTFSRKYDLLRHNQMHCKKVPFKCHVCEKEFKNKKKFDGHLCLYSRKYVQFVSIRPKT